MPVTHIGDSRIYAARAKPGVQRPRTWAGKKEKTWYYEYGLFLIRVCYRPFQGMLLEGLERRDGKTVSSVTTFPSLRNQRMKKVSINIDAAAPLPVLTSESATFKKFPLFRDFMTSRAYGDGTPRLAGRIWLDSDGIAFTLTLFDKTGCGKMRCRAETLDDVFALAERHLGSDNPPWESDEYEAERQRGIQRLRGEKKKKRN